MKCNDMSFLETIFEAMTDELRSDFQKLFIAAKNDKSKYGKIMDKLSDRMHFTIDKEKIHWYPYIDYDRCTNCKKCITSCKKQIYYYNVENCKIELKNYTKCAFLCKECEEVCSDDAIILPKRIDMLEYFYFK